MKTVAERRLAAIMIADVAGFSRLMERDESLTFARLRKIREDVTHARVEAHGGRIIKTTGDGFLAEFSSTTTAVRCGMEIQRSVIASQVKYPDDERIRFRIGINVGDIIVDGADVAGDGVNIAARLEPLAPLDGIALSASVREQIRDDLGVPFEDLGEKVLKNISRPIRVFALHVEALAESEPPPPPVTEPRRMAEVVKAEPVAADPAPSPAVPAKKGVPLAALVAAGAVVAGLAGFALLRGPSTSAPAPAPAASSAASSAPPAAADPAPPAAGAQPAVTAASSPPAKKKSEAKPKLTEWHAGLREALKVCEKEGGSFGCSEGARWKYCAPDHWNEVEECKVGR